MISDQLVRSERLLMGRAQLQPAVPVVRGLNSGSIPESSGHPTTFTKNRDHGCKRRAMSPPRSIDAVPIDELPRSAAGLLRSNTSPWNRIAVGSMGQPGFRRLRGRSGERPARGPVQSRTVNFHGERPSAMTPISRRPISEADVVLRRAKDSEPSWRIACHVLLDNRQGHVSCQRLRDPRDGDHSNATRRCC